MNIARANLPGNLGLRPIGFGIPDRQSLLRAVANFCIFEAAFYFAYRFGMSFSPACAAPFWFPDSVLLCAFLLCPPRLWWLVVLAPLPIRLLVAVPPDTPLWFLLGSFAIDSAKGVLSAGILRRTIKNPFRLETVQDFAVFSLFAVLLVPMAGAFGGAALRQALGYPYWPAWEQWFVGNVLAQMIVTPALFYLVLGVPWNAPATSFERKIEGGILAVCLTLAGYFAANSEAGGLAFTELRYFAPVPFLFWAAIRFGMFGAAGSITLITFLSVQAVLTGHGPFAGMSPHDTAHALQNFLLLRAAPLYVVAILIEQKRRDERTLRESEALNRSVVHSLSGVVVILDRSGHVLATNSAGEAAAPLDGSPLPEAEVGANYLAACRHAARIGTPSCAGLLEDLESILSGREAHFQKEYSVTTPGGTVWFEVSITPLQREAGGAVLSQRNITIRKRAEAEVLELNRELTHASRGTTLGQMVATFAHELNQPLAAILSNAQAGLRFAADGACDAEEIRAILNDVVRDDKRAGQVIHNLRAMVKKQPTDREACSLNELVREVGELIRSEMIAAKIEVRSRPAAQLPLVEVARVELQQVLLNLLVNARDAMEATPSGRRTIDVETRADADRVTVVVRDHGPGIPPDRLPAIFDPFVSTKANGLGMGLAICRRIVENHGGRLEARNHDGGGAVFSISLPAAAK